MKHNVVLLKLKHSFLDVICYVDDETKSIIEKLAGSDTIEVESPVIWQMVKMQNEDTGKIEQRPMPQNVSFFIDDDAKDLNLTLRLDDILFGTTANSELAREYKKMMSGIEEASTSDISMINQNKGS